MFLVLRTQLEASWATPRNEMTAQNWDSRVALSFRNTNEKGARDKRAPCFSALAENSHYTKFKSLLDGDTEVATQVTPH